MPFAGEEKWARPAGHPGDKSVPCAPGTGCTYSLDVTGGWYDAGDHGKYVVNGGISVWTLLNQYERAKHLGTSSGDFADGKLAIPEGKNGVPDILDEARWELEFMLKMQVPAGNPLAGMVHHKMHDEKWTALGMAPHEDAMKRYLRAPSTAATLNVAATAAQAARIWKTIDPAFSAKCLAASERAWAAAQSNPAVYALGSDNSGGGPYDDKNVTDEVYWAAAELFLTTGKDVYKEAVTRSPLFKVIPGPRSGAASSMAWQDTQALGTISLSLVPSSLDAAALAATRASLVASADAYLDVIETQGYRLPMKPGGGNKYPWGSNSMVLNNLIILSRGLGPVEGKDTNRWVPNGPSYEAALVDLRKKAVAGGGNHLVLDVLTPPNALDYVPSFSIQARLFACPAARAKVAPLPARVEPSAQPAPARTCEPDCSPGYTCLRAVCVSACNPLCGAGERCGVDRICLPDTVPAR